MEGWLAPAAAALLLALAFAALRPPAVGAAACALFLVPAAAYASTTWLAPVQGTFPAAGPHAAAGPGGVGLEGEDRRIYPRLARYIALHAAHERFALLTVSSVAAAPLILMGIHAAA